MENKDKESIQQQPAKESIKGVKTPEPPQLKDISKEAASDRDVENSEKGSGSGAEKSQKGGADKATKGGADRSPKAGDKEQAGKPAPANNREEQNKPPTTTTNR